MVLQENHPNKKIQRYGCYFLSLLRICEVESKKELSIDNIQTLYESALKNNYIDINCTCLKPDNILALGFSFLGCKKKVYQIGQKKNGKTEFWGWVKDNNYQYVILGKKRPNGFHFVLDGKDIFDPNPTLTGEIVREIFYKIF